MTRDSVSFYVLRIVLKSFLEGSGGLHQRHRRVVHIVAAVIYEFCLAHAAPLVVSLTEVAEVRVD